jgi:PEP-CTERM motif
MTYKLKTLVLLTSALISAQISTASTVNWSLNGVAFSDGATASGTFDWDATSQSISNWNINVTSGLLSAFAYTPVDSTAGAFLQAAGYEKTYFFSVTGSTRQLRLTPLAPLTDQGGTIGINLNTFGGGSGSVECFNCSPYRPVVGGSFTTATTIPASTPEPTSVGLMGLGLVASVFLARKV